MQKRLRGARIWKTPTHFSGIFNTQNALEEIEMIAIIDYGMANLRSVERALIAVGGEPVITGDPEVVAKADHVILPGVGAFCACMS